MCSSSYAHVGRGRWAIVNPSRKDQLNISPSLHLRPSQYIKVQLCRVRNGLNYVLPKQGIGQKLQVMIRPCLDGIPRSSPHIIKYFNSYAAFIGQGDKHQLHSREFLSALHSLVTYVEHFPTLICFYFKVVQSWLNSGSAKLQQSPHSLLLQRRIRIQSRKLSKKPRKPLPVKQPQQQQMVLVSSQWGVSFRFRGLVARSRLIPARRQI